MSRTPRAERGRVVAVTGAAGIIGGVVRDRLSTRFRLRLLTHRPASFPSRVIDLADLSDLVSAFEGADTVLHLAAAATVESEWEEVLAANIVGTRNVFEAAVRAGASKVVFASSNHVVGGYEAERAPQIYRAGANRIIGEDAPMRPDSLYGVSKAFGEVLGRYYAEHRGLSVICLRLGTVRPDDDITSPEIALTARWLSLTTEERYERIQATWLSQRDCAALLEAAIEAQVSWLVAYGVSNNRNRFWSLEASQAVLGFRPLDEGGATRSRPDDRVGPESRAVASRDAGERPQETSRVSVDALKAFVRACGVWAGVPETQIGLFVDSFLEADLRGVGTHGVARIPAYVRALGQGIVNPSPTVRTVVRTASAALLDADNGLGMITGQLAMDLAVEISSESGIGLVSVRNSNHSGMLAIHVLRAAAARKIGFFTSSAPAIMPPWGGAEPRLSNGPFAWALPREDAPPIVVDMAASAAARGKVRQIAAGGGRIPAGWALDREGQPTTDARAAMAGLILPMAEHKGYGIALVNDALSAALSGAALATETPREFLREGSTVLDSWRIGHLAIAIDPHALAGQEVFHATIERLAAAVQECATAPGFDVVLLPGEPEWRRRVENLSLGVALPQVTVRALNDFAAEIGIKQLA